MVDPISLIVPIIPVVVKVAAVVEFGAALSWSPLTLSFSPLTSSLSQCLSSRRWPHPPLAWGDLLNLFDNESFRVALPKTAASEDYVWNPPPGREKVVAFLTANAPVHYVTGGVVSAVETQAWREPLYWLSTRLQRSCCVRCRRRCCGCVVVVAVFRFAVAVVVNVIGAIGAVWLRAVGPDSGDHVLALHEGKLFRCFSSLSLLVICCNKRRLGTNASFTGTFPPVFPSPIRSTRCGTLAPGATLNGSTLGADCVDLKKVQQVHLLAA